MEFQNGSNKVVIELRVVQFWSEIILVISNRTRAVRSFDFEMTRMISDQIALHSVQLPLLIHADNLSTTKLFEYWWLLHMFSYRFQHKRFKINNLLSNVSKCEDNTSWTYTLLSCSQIYIMNHLLNKHRCALIMTYPYFDLFESSRL